VPFLIGAIHPSFILVHPVILITLHIAFIIWFYISKKLTLFALPLSHLLFPFLFYFSLAWIRSYMPIKPDPAGWEMFAIAAGFFYFLPFSVITLIISFVIWRIL